MVLSPRMEPEHGGFLMAAVGLSSSDVGLDRVNAAEAVSVDLLRRFSSRLGLTLVGEVIAKG